VAPARRWQRKITDRNPSQPPPLFTQLPGGALPATNTRPTGPYHFCLGLEGRALRALRSSDLTTPFPSVTSYVSPRTVVACDALACCPGSLPCLRHSSGFFDAAPLLSRTLTKRRGLGGLLFRDLSGLELNQIKLPLLRSTSSWAASATVQLPTSALTTLPREVAYRPCPLGRNGSQ
jgi:hypothetical protein